MTAPGVIRPPARVITDLTVCPDCGEDAVISVGGDHGGPDLCMQRPQPATPRKPRRR